MASSDPKDIESLVELFNQSDWNEMHLKTADFEIFLSNDPQATGPSARATEAPAVAATPVEQRTSDGAPETDTPAPDAEVPQGMLAVSAPNLGTFYRSPKPGEPPYVEVGQRVGEESEVCLIEVMKLFTPVRAGTAGVVKEIRIEDGQMVEFEQVLLVIDPNA